MEKGRTNRANDSTRHLKTHTISNTQVGAKHVDLSLLWFECILDKFIVNTFSCAMPISYMASHDLIFQATILISRLLNYNMCTFIESTVSLYHSVLLVCSIDLVCF